MSTKSSPQKVRIYKQVNSSRLKDFLQGQKREMGPKKSLGGSSSASYYLLFPDGQTTVEHHWIRLVCIFVPATQLSFGSNYNVQLSSRGLPCLCPATVFVHRACITRSPSTSDQRQVPAHRCSPLTGSATNVDQTNILNFFATVVSFFMFSS